MQYKMANSNQFLCNTYYVYVMLYKVGTAWQDRSTPYVFVSYKIFSEKYIIYT